MSESEPEHAPEESDNPRSARRFAGMFRFISRGTLVLASVVAFALSAASWVAFDQGVTSSKVLEDEPHAQPRDDGATDILLVGNDSRTDALGNPLPWHVLKELRTEGTTGINTDTLILLRIPHSGAEPSAVSIPRDTEVSIRDNSEKINAVYGLTQNRTEDRLVSEGVTDPQQLHEESALAGQRALVRTVRDLTGTRVDHYAEVNLLGFYEITKAVGGVEVCLNQATTDTDSGADFAAGHQTISGGDALAFVRQRHGLPRGDLDRVVRQQAFLAALSNKLLSAGTLTDPEKLHHLVDAAHRSVVLDADWNMAAFIERMREVAGGGVRFETLPIAEAGARDADGRYVVRVNREQARRFVAGLVARPPGMSPVGRIQLDGTAHRQPITSNGVPCVN